MGRRVVKRYSECFKRQVVAEVESGRFPSLEQARLHYEIGGTATIQGWLKAYGKNHLLPRRVRVEQLDEADRLAKLRREVEGLHKALGRTQAENVLNATYLELACEQLGQEVDAFKKKAGGRRSIEPVNKEGRA